MEPRLTSEKNSAKNRRLTSCNTVTSALRSFLPSPVGNHILVRFHCNTSIKITNCAYYNLHAPLHLQEKGVADQGRPRVAMETTIQTRLEHGILPLRASWLSVATLVSIDHPYRFNSRYQPIYHELCNFYCTPNYGFL